jgi:hypothetical protein
MGWSFDVGPLHMGSEGVGVRPQMKVGYADDNVKLAAGLDDVRDGISGGVMGRVHRKYTAEGNSMKEVRSCQAWHAHACSLSPVVGLRQRLPGLPRRNMACSLGSTVPPVTCQVCIFALSTGADQAQE